MTTKAPENRDRTIVEAHSGESPYVRAALSQMSQEDRDRYDTARFARRILIPAALGIAVGNFGYRAGISGWEMTEAVKFGLFQGAFYYGTFRGLAAVTSGAIITKVKGLAAHLRDSGADPEAIIAAARPEAPATPPATPPAGTPPEAPPSGLASALAKPDLPRLRRPGKSGAGADPQPGRDTGRD
jgi:hypothetical protein